MGHPAHVFVELTRFSYLAALLPWDLFAHLPELWLGSPDHSDWLLNNFGTCLYITLILENKKKLPRQWLINKRTCLPFPFRPILQSWQSSGLFSHLDAPFFSGFRETVTCTESSPSSEEKNEVGPRGVFPLLHLTPNLTIFPSSFSPFSTVDRRNLAREALYPSFPSSSVLGASGRTDGQRLLPLSPLLYFPHGRPE